MVHVQQRLYRTLEAFRNGARPLSDLSHELAQALRWTEGIARSENVSSSIIPNATRVFVGNEPAAIFVAANADNQRAVLQDAALYAYHASVEWGLVATANQAVVFNSHRVKNSNWYQLPPIQWESSQANLDIINAFTPEGFIDGRIEDVTSKRETPDSLLLAVDDALVSRLDTWRSQTLRHSKGIDKVDEKLQNLFAQLFVLRVVEDRKVATHVDSLSKALNDFGGANHVVLNTIFAQAQQTIKSDLFDQIEIDDIPDFILGGIIRDLYYPNQLPIYGAKYNFAWIDADVLGQAYEKYLSTLLVPSEAIDSQLHLWEQPIREVERVSVRKSSGVYYTPSYLVRYLTEKCVDDYYKDHADADAPTVADISCGSGSFLTSVADTLIRRLRQSDPSKNWGRELINNKKIVGIDLDNRAVTLARLSLWLRLAEEPDPLPLPRLAEVIVQGDSLSQETWLTLPTSYDIIVGNPPFIAVGNVQTRKELQARFETAQGRFDYSYLFVEQAITKIVPGGSIGLVIPNRLYRNRDASTLRSIITRECTMRTAVDFGSNEVFTGTSAYVGTIVASKRKQNQEENNVRFIKVGIGLSDYLGALLIEADSSTDNIKNENLSAYNSSLSVGGNAWLFLSPFDRVARLRLQDELSYQMSEVAGVRQGIKTGANDIYIVDIEEYSDSLVRVSNKFSESFLIERQLLKPVVFGGEIQRYETIQPRRFLVFPYRANKSISEAELREMFPYGFKYLSHYRDLLGSRSSVSADSGTSWYEIVRPRDEVWLESQKLLTRDLATQTSFAVDTIGTTYLVGGTAVWPLDIELLLPLMGYLNSRLVNWYLSQVNSSFRGEFQKYEAQHLLGLPILKAIVDDDDVKEQMRSLVVGIAESKSTPDTKAQSEAEEEIDRLLCKLAGISLSDIL